MIDTRDGLARLNRFLLPEAADAFTPILPVSSVTARETEPSRYSFPIISNSNYGACLMSGKREPLSSVRQNAMESDNCETL
jgi:hypothetical protein